MGRVLLNNDTETSDQSVAKSIARFKASESKLIRELLDAYDDAERHIEALKESLNE